MVQQDTDAELLAQIREHLKAINKLRRQLKARGVNLKLVADEMGGPLRASLVIDAGRG